MSANENKSKMNAIMAKALQVIPIVFTAIVVVLCIAFIVKNNITLRNLDSLATYFTGGTVAMALGMIGFHLVKSFGLVISPVWLYTLAGIIFEDFWVAVTVNFIGTFISLFLPYYLGKFMGMDAVGSLKKRFKAIDKLDNFTGENVFSIVFVFKAACIMPSDLNSLVFGAMNLPFGEYFLSSNIALFILNILWTLLGSKGDLTDIRSYVYILPIVPLVIGGSLYITYKAKKAENKKTEDSNPSA